MAAAQPRVEEPVRYERCAAVHRASAEVVRRTPIITSASVSERCDGAIALKAECFQRTGSFKLRGALSKLRAIGANGQGVVAGSAGNHAQSLAYAARLQGIACEVYMPFDASVSKLAAVRAFGATARQEAATVDECVALAQERAAVAGLTFVHPFDDWDVIAGQAGLGIELIEDVPAMSKAIVPIGGGGLASGVALAIKQRRPDVEVVGVQARAYASVAASLQLGTLVVAPVSETIADGIAIKRPGALTLPLLERWLDGVATVGEEAIAEAMVLLLERCKLVVEGAGAAALAALMSGAVEPARSGTTVVVLSGGNVDVGLLATIAAHEETRAGRRSRILARISDRPGALADLLAVVAGAHANVISVEHVRDGVPLALRETGVALTVETHGSGHLEQVLAGLKAAGHDSAEAADA